MSLKSHSKIVFDEHSVNVLLKQILGKGSPVKSFKARHEGDHLHLKIGINYDNVPGWIDLPIIGKMHPVQPLMGDHVEADFRLSVSGRNLKGNLDFHGMGAVIQRAVGMLGIDSIIFFFAPHLKKVGALKIHGVYDFDFDLSSVRVPDGKGGEMKLTDLVKFHSISVGNGKDTMLNVEFSVIEEGGNNHV